MKVLVFVKAVPREIVRLKIAEDGDRVLCERLALTANESDEYALEQALALKAAFGCEVTVATVGPLMCQDVVYLGLAKGADQGVRIDVDVNDPEILSTVIARAVSKLGHDLILTGVESWDNLAAQVGTLTAAKLGIPSAYAVTKVEAGAGPETLKVTKELGQGLQQAVEMPLPALLCIQSGAQPLSYAAPAKILRARRNPLKLLRWSDLGLDKDATMGRRWFRFTEVRVPEKKQQAELLEGDAKRVAELILARVKNEVR